MKVMKKLNEKEIIRIFRQTKKNIDDTKRYIDATPNLTEAEKQLIFFKNAYSVYPRLSKE